MNPWLVGVLAWLALNIVLAFVWVVAVKILEAQCAEWEEDEFRCIAASNDDDIPRPLDKWATSARGAAADEPCRGLPQQPLPTDDLPANWQDQDAYNSWLDACAEMRRRKTGGA